MAAVPGVTRRLRDAVRDSKIRKDIPSKPYQKIDSFASEEDREDRVLDGWRHHLYYGSHQVGRDFPRTTEDGVAAAGFNIIEPEGHQVMGVASSFDEVERWFHYYIEKEAPFLGVYRKNTASESIIERFKRNLPDFDGFWHDEDLLNWIDAIEDFFEETNPPEKVKCEIVSYKMKGRAYYWWKVLQNERFSVGKNPISSWSKMRKLVISKFAPSLCSKKGLAEVHRNNNSGANVRNSCVECSNGKDVCNEPDNMPTNEVVVSEINAKHEEEKEEKSQEIEGQALPIGEGKKDDRVIHLNDIGDSIKEDNLSKVMTDMDMLKYALMKEISVKGQEPQAKHGVHRNHWSNTSRIGNEIGAKVQRLEKELNGKQALWSPNNVAIIADEMLTLSFDPGGVTKRGDAFTLLISKAAIADLLSNEALKEKMIVTHDLEAILKLIMHMNLINGEYSGYTNAIVKFATILFDPGGVLCPVQTTCLSNDFKADNAMPKFCDWNFDMVKGILVGNMANDGLCISGLIKIEAKVVELAHVAKLRDQMKQEWVNANQGPEWVVCCVMATLESNTTHVTVDHRQLGMVIIMKHGQCNMLGTKMESFNLKLIFKHTCCSCVMTPMNRSVTTGVDAYLTPFLKRYLYEFLSKLHSYHVLRYPHIMVKAEIAMRIVLCLYSWLANRHDGLVCLMMVNLLKSQARVTRLYFPPWYTCRVGVWLTKCVAIIFLRSLNEFSANINQLNMVVLLPLSHTSGSKKLVPLTHITFADVPFLVTNVFHNVFVCSMHLNRVLYEHFGQPLFIAESMYYVRVSVEGSPHVLSTFNIETPGRKLFIPIIVVIDLRAKITVQALSIYSRSCIRFRYSTPNLKSLVIELSLSVMVLCLKLCLWMNGQILTGYSMGCLTHTGSSWLHGKYKENILPILIHHLGLYQRQTNGGDQVSYEQNSEMLRGLLATLRFLWDGLRQEDLSIYPGVDLARGLVMSWEGWKDEKDFTNMKKDFTIGKRGIDNLIETSVCLYNFEFVTQMLSLKLCCEHAAPLCLFVVKSISRFVPNSVDAYLTPFLKAFIYRFRRKTKEISVSLLITCGEVSSDLYTPSLAVGAYGVEVFKAYCNTLALFELHDHLGYHVARSNLLSLYYYWPSWSIKPNRLLLQRYWKDENNYNTFIRARRYVLRIYLCLSIVGKNGKMFSGSIYA